MASALVQTFLEFFLSVYHTILFPSHWLLSHIAITETMDKCERGLNPVDYHRSMESILAVPGIEPTACSQVLYATN